MKIPAFILLGATGLFILLTACGSDGEGRYSQENADLTSCLGYGRTPTSSYTFGDDLSIAVRDRNSILYLYGDEDSDIELVMAVTLEPENGSVKAETLAIYNRVPVQLQCEGDWSAVDGFASGSCTSGDGQEISFEGCLVIGGGGGLWWSAEGSGYWEL